ncbi:hypothetical protein [Nocardia sp. NPDC003345]
MFGDQFWDDYHLEFVDYAMMDPGSGAHIAILLPVESEPQAERLRSVRSRCPMSLVVAVTHDVTGHSTYYAMRSGASFVINLAIPGPQQSDLLRAHLRNLPGVVHDAARGPDLQLVSVRADARTTDEGIRVPVPEGAEATARTGTESGGGHRGLSRAESQLVRMLRTPMTIAEIARHNYMSERSMYRRVRALYNVLGVTGRSELMGSPPADESGNPARHRDLMSAVPLAAR